MAQTGKNLPAVQETQLQPLDQEGSLEKGVATHTSILAWKIPRTEEAGRLQLTVSPSVVAVDNALWSDYYKEDENRSG